MGHNLVGSSSLPPIRTTSSLLSFNDGSIWKPESSPFLPTNTGFSQTHRKNVETVSVGVQTMSLSRSFFPVNESTGRNPMFSIPSVGSVSPGAGDLTASISGPVRPWGSKPPNKSLTMHNQSAYLKKGHGRGGSSVSSRSVNG